MDWKKIDDDFIANYASITSALPQRITNNLRALDGEKRISYNLVWEKNTEFGMPEFSTGSMFETAIPVWLPPLASVAQRLSFVQIEVTLTLAVSGSIKCKLRFQNLDTYEHTFTGTGYSSEVSNTFSFAVPIETFAAAVDAETGGWCELLFGSVMVAIPLTDCERKTPTYPSGGICEFVMKAGSTWPWLVGKIHGEYRNSETGETLYLGRCLDATGSIYSGFQWPYRRHGTGQSGLSSGKYNGNLYTAGSARLLSYSCSVTPGIPSSATNSINAETQPYFLVDSGALRDLAMKNAILYQNRRRIITAGVATGNMDSTPQEVLYYRKGELHLKSKYIPPGDTFGWFTLTRQTLFRRADTKSLNLTLAYTFHTLRATSEPSEFGIKVAVSSATSSTTYASSRYPSHLETLIGSTLMNSVFGTGGLTSVGDYANISLMTISVDMPSSLAVGARYDITVSIQQQKGWGAKFFLAAIQDQGVF